MLPALPSDILFGILQHASSRSIYVRMCFKDQLYLLGIFQRLRSIALPMIYSHVYITFNKYDNNKTPHYQNKHSNTFAEYIDTNADITALASCTHMVKSAMVDLWSSSTVYAEFYDIIEALKSCSVSWPNITKLELNFDYGSNCGILSESQLMQYHCWSERLGQALSSALPSVTELELANEGMSPDINEFYKYAVNTYADQLLKFSNWCEFDYTGRHKLNVLQYLNVSIYRYNISIPRVNSHTLVELYINSMSYNFSWAPFMDSKDDAAIEFPCLKKLRLSFTNFDIFQHTEITDVDLPKMQLNFPVLSSLTVKCSRGSCSFFKMARFPKKMEYIYLYIRSSMLAQLKKWGCQPQRK